MEGVASAGIPTTARRPPELGPWPAHPLTALPLTEPLSAPKKQDGFKAKLREEGVRVSAGSSHSDLQALAEIVTVELG